MTKRHSTGVVGVSPRRRGRAMRAVGLVGLMLLSAIAIGFTAGAAQTGSTTESQAPFQATGISSCTVIDEPGKYVLTSDVRDSDANACLDIRASDVVIDGNGHVVDGASGADSIGVSVAGTQETAASIENVTVRDVTVTDWGTGIQAGLPMVAGPEVTLRDVAVSDSGSGIRLGEADDSELHNVRVSDGGDGIYVVESTVEMRSVVVSENDGYGVLFGQASTGTSLTGARITDNGGDGVVFGGLTEEVTVSKATISDNGGTGVTIDRDVSDVMLRNSVVSNNTATGIVSRARTASGNDVMDTVVANNENDGIRVLGSGVSFHNVSFDGNHRYAYNATRNPDDDPLVVEDLRFRGHSISGVAPRLGLRLPTHFPSLPEGTEMAGLPLLVEGLSSDASIELSMEYGRFDDVDPDEDVGVWHNREGGTDGWSELADAERIADANRVTVTTAQNGTYLPLTSGGRDDGERPTPTASTFEVRSTSEDGQFAYRFTVDGAVEKTKLGDDGIAADVSDVISREGDSVVVDGSTGDGEGDAYTVTGDIASFEVVSGPRDVELFLDDENVTGELLDVDLAPPGRILEVHSTADDTEFSYRFEVDGDVEKTRLGEGGIAADDDDVVRSGGDSGTSIVGGSTGDGAGDAYVVHGELGGFEIGSGSDEYRVVLDGEDITDRVQPPPETRILEIQSTNEESEFGYRVVVDGDAEKTQLGDGGVAADASDEVTRDDGTITIDGSTGDGAGDAYRVTGSVETVQITSGPPDVRILLGGEDVTDRFLDRPPARTFAIRTTDEDD